MDSSSKDKKQTITDIIKLTLHHLFLRIQKFRLHQIQALQWVDKVMQVLLELNTPQGEMKRKHSHLNVVPNGDPPTNSRTDGNQESSHHPVIRSVTGIAIYPPDRFAYVLT